MKLKDVFNVPNTITYIGFGLTILGLAILKLALISQNGLHWSWAIGILVSAAITDWLDGYIARKLHQATELGAQLDPLRDKLLLIGVVLILNVYWAIIAAIVEGVSAFFANRLKKIKGRIYITKASKTISVTQTFYGVVLLVVYTVGWDDKLFLSDFLFFIIIALSGARAVSYYKEIKSSK